MSQLAKIAALGRLCGIIPEYFDNFGRRHRTSQSTFRALLTAMGVPWEDPAELDRELAAKRLAPYDRLLSPVAVVFQGAGCRVPVFPLIPADQAPPRLEVRWEITDEAGRVQTWETVALPPGKGGSRRGPEGWRTRVELKLPARLKPGYYDLCLRLAGGTREETGCCRLIVAPDRAYLPEWLTDDQRLWGFNVPLYALRSENNWGIGDFGDLLALTDWAGSLNASFVGVNPLHAPASGAKGVPSPYSPSSRLFRNFLYLDLEAVPELAISPAAQAFLAGPEFRRRKARLVHEPLVPYPGVFRLKRRVLEMLYRTFLDRHGPAEAPRTARGEEFARYLAERGDALGQFGLYQALTESLKQADWRRWPRAFQDPQAAAVAEFRRQHPAAIGLHQYGQWLAAAQLGQVCARARSRGLPFTLYQDLALAGEAGGFDTWANQGLFARGIEIGAPADAFNPRGQSWGIPPLIPERLREAGHRFFMDILRANAPPGGMLRIDHVMGLFRLFWIPRGETASQGAYVRYPSRELLAILCLESARRRTLIIGEDLGTVPPSVRRDLDRRGALSYRVFYFERNPDNSFRSPEEYPRRAMAAVTTHDLPTLMGFWQGRDLELKRFLTLYPCPHLADADAAAREEDRRRLVAALENLHLLPTGSGAAPQTRTGPEDLPGGVVEYLARTRAALLELRLEEVFKVAEQQNLPGTTREHPNWNRKLPLSLEEMRRDPEPARLAARLNRYRGR